MTFELAITFMRPSVLVLLALVPLLWFLPRRFPNAIHGLLRSLAVAALVLALAEPAMIRLDEKRTVQVAIVDHSVSVAPGQPSLSTDALFGPMPTSAERIAIHVGASPDRAAADASITGDNGIESIVIDANASATRGRDSLGVALDEALLRIPEGVHASMTLATDGAATHPSWRASVQRIAARGIPVFVIPRRRKGPDAYPRRIQLVEAAVAGQTARVHIDVVGVVPRGEVVLFADEVEVAREKVTQTSRSPMVLEFEPERPGWAQLRAELRSDAASDVVQDNNAVSTWIPVDDPIRIHYAGSRMVGAQQALEKALGRGFSLVPFQVDTSSQGDLQRSLASSELLWLDDIPASQLSPAAHESISNAVRDDGLGLLYSGGQQAFGPGGYVDTPIAKLLPLEPNQKEEKRDPSTTLVVIIDTSGSMGGERVQLAKEVARLGMRRLLPHDKVGIVEFYGAKRWAAPIQPASNAIELQRALNRLDAGGGTVIMPAIEEAYYGLRNVQTRYKHVLMLTDGGVESGAFEPLIRKMAEKGITTSTVLVGPDAHSEFLVNIATWGRGRYYSVPNRFNLPEILLKQPTNARLPSYRQGRVEVSITGGPSWFGGRLPKSVPALDGYAECNLRAGAELVLETKTRRHPVLASWMMEAGRVTALATEPTGPGMAPWRDLDAYGDWLARWVRRTARVRTGPYRYSIEQSGGATVVVARSRTTTSTTPVVHLVDDTGSPTQSLPFRAVADGVYRADVPTSERPTRLIAGEASGRRQRLVATPFPLLSPELQENPSNRMPLAQIARATGGQVITEPGASKVDVARVRGDVPNHIVPLWPWFFIAALLGYLADVAWRRRP